MKKDYSLNKNH